MRPLARDIVGSFLCVSALLSAPAEASGQRIAAERLRPGENHAPYRPRGRAAGDDRLRSSVSLPQWTERDAARWNAERDRRPASAWAILASSVIPGAGQAMLRQWRALPYLALEGLAWSQYRTDARGARRDRDTYRLIAATVARAPFGGFLPNGDFDYYERMETFLESGVFDANPGGDLQPEQDTTTYNGAMWLLARRTYWKDPHLVPDRSSTEWQRAESFYNSRAIRPEYRWSWKEAPAELDRFRRYIRASNDSYRAAVADLGVVIGNHLLSTVDSYVSVQLRRRRTATGRSLELSVDVPF